MYTYIIVLVNTHVTLLSKRFGKRKQQEFKADGISAKNANQMPLTTVQLDGRAAVILVAFSVLLLIKYIISSIIYNILFRLGTR